MIDFGVFLEIKKKAISSIKSDSSGKKIDSKKANCVFVLVFYILPIICAVVSWLFDVKLSNIVAYITTAISIFTGLFFSLLLNIGTKIRLEKDNKNKDNLNFNAIKENMRQISYITQYVIILGIFIVLIIFFNYILTFKCELVNNIFTSIIVFVLLRYFSCLFFMLQRFYFVLRDELDNIL